MKNWIYLIFITSIIVILGPYLVTKAFAFTLNVELTNKPFGDRDAWVQIQGPNGFSDSKWYNWASIRTATNAGMVTLNLPDNAFPIGENYKVCISSNHINYILSPWCSSFVHQSNEESISLRIG